MTFATDSMGSYALEAFLKSRFVPSEKKHVLIEKLKGTFVRLACEKQGSHVVETCWRQAEVRYKEAITQELLFSEQQLNGNFYGRIVLRNCGVEHLKRKDKTWLEKEQKAVKKRKFLEEILEERQDIKHTKKVKLVEDGKSKNFGREMAALGFTASGENAVDSEEEDDADDAKGSVDAAFEKKPKKDQYANKNMQTEKKKKNRSSNETDKLAELEFIDSAIKATKSLKKSKKEEKKKK